MNLYAMRFELRVAMGCCRSRNRYTVRTHTCRELSDKTLCAPRLSDGLSSDASDARTDKSTGTKNLVYLRWLHSRRSLNFPINQPDTRFVYPRARLAMSTAPHSYGCPTGSRRSPDFGALRVTPAGYEAHAGHCENDHNCTNGPALHARLCFSPLTHRSTKRQLPGAFTVSETSSAFPVHRGSPPGLAEPDRRDRLRRDWARKGMSIPSACPSD